MKKTLTVVTALAMIAGSASAALVVEYNTGAHVGKSLDAVDLGTSIAADAGDVIVFTSASSKSYVKSYSVTSADGGAVGAESGVFLDKNASVSYFTVTSGGTFDLSAAGNDLTFDTFGAYVLGSDQVGESVVEIASAQTYVGANVSTANTLDYGTVSSGGIAVEVANTGGGWSSFPAGYTVFANGAGSRASLYGSFSAGALTSDYVSGDITKNSRTGGIAFAAIPEPASMGLFGVFGGMALFIRRRVLK
jgi:hypothetical protein